MKKFFFLLLPLATALTARVSAGVTGLEDWGAGTNDITLSIEVEGNRSQIKTNQSFQVVTRIENKSTNSPFYFLSPAAIFNGGPFYFEVISPSGKEIAPAPPRIEVGSAEKITVRPNQVYEHDFNPGYLCKFSEVGTYRILAKIKVGRVKHKEQWAVSAPLYVVVVAGK
jgi:hypothetical protein